jgi:tetratricopeptide (TPR) repeat protein
MRRVARWFIAGVLLSVLCGAYTVPARADCGDLSGPNVGQAAPYDPAVLVKTYDCLLAIKSPAVMWADRAERLKTLEGAGVKNLLSGPGGLPLAERVAILNDYGLWQYDLHRFDQAQATLELAVQLTPNNAAGWLRLGDSYAGPIPDEQSWAGELTLTRKALNAYRHYIELTPAPDQRVKDFLALNLTSAATGDVCQFVTDLSNERRLDDILSSLGGGGFDASDPTPPVDLLGNGTKYYVYILQPETGEPGWIPPEHIAVYKASADAEMQAKGEGFPDRPSDVDLSPLMTGKADEMEGQLAVFRIKNLYYILVSNPSDANDAIQGLGTLDVHQDPRDGIIIVQPNHGALCHIVPRIKANLALGQGNPLCEQFLRGVKFPQPPKDTSDANDKITVDPGTSPINTLLATSKVDLENNGRMRIIAFFDDGWSQRITLYDPDKRAAIKSKLADAIGDLKPNFDSEEYFINYSGRTYIETDHDGGDLLPGEATGEGIYEARNEGVFPVCLIRNDFTYTIESRQKP